MFKIEKLNYPKTLVDRVPVFPVDDEDDYLHNYDDSDVGSCVSTLGIEAIISNGVFRMGDSDTVVKVTDTGVRGDAGLSMLQKYAEDFVVIAKESLSAMSPDFQAFYTHIINDFDKHGINMPLHGRL